MDTRGWRLGLFVVIMALALCGGAQADYNGYSNAFPSPEELGLGYSVAFGAAFPVDSDNDAPTAFTMSLAWYDPLGYEFGNQTTIGISGDWLMVERESDDKTVSLFPVLINFKAYTIIYSYRVFATVGIGAIYATDDVPNMKYSDGFNFGWSGGVGVDLSNHVFTQIRFIGSDNPSDDGMLSFQVGYRF